MEITKIISVNFNFCRLHRVKVNPEFLEDGKKIKFYNMVYV